MIAFFFTIPIRSTMPMMEMTFRSTLKSISASMAPTLADGRVEMIVSGWTRLSYKMPRTIYTASSAVRIRMGSVLSDCWYASSVPGKKPGMVEGVPSRFCNWLMLDVASLNDKFDARLKDTVTEGNKPVWLTASGIVLDWRSEEQGV